MVGSAFSGALASDLVPHSHCQQFPRLHKQRTKVGDQL